MPTEPLNISEQNRADITGLEKRTYTLESRQESIEQRQVELTLRIAQQENLIIELTTSIVETAAAVANIAACIRGTTDRQLVQYSRILVSKVLKRIKPLVEPVDDEAGCQCGGRCKGGE